jgi:hypothetical protein
VVTTEEAVLVDRSNGVEADIEHGWVILAELGSRQSGVAGQRAGNTFHG